MHALCLFLAILSIWDYPARQPRHEQLRNQFLVALRRGDTITMESACRQAVEIFPEDPTWRYNLACSLAYFEKPDAAFDELEKAIDLGFRDVKQMREDRDLARISGKSRFRELMAYAEEIKTKPILFGPAAAVAATGVTGGQVALGSQNLSWDFESGCFVAHLRLAATGAGGNTGDIYVNRDAGHSTIKAADFFGLTTVRLDAEGRAKKMDLFAPNTLYPYPTFGNCSMAMTHPSYWRSLSRAFVTLDRFVLPRMVKFYLSNQTWVFPSNLDTPPAGTNGDVFASLTPYWITSAGRSYSDQPILKAALTASKSLPSETKRAAVAKGLLAPTIQTLMRKAFKSVTNETDYLSPRAHPTAFPTKAIDTVRLSMAAASLKPEEIPPLATIRVLQKPARYVGQMPELTYGTSFAWAFILRAEQEERTFVIRASGAEEFRFVQTHGGPCAKIESVAADVAQVTLTKAGITPTNRVDIAVFGRNKGTSWGAPSYVSFAVLDPEAPYCDPALAAPVKPPPPPQKTPSAGKTPPPAVKTPPQQKK